MSTSTRRRLVAVVLAVTAASTLPLAAPVAATEDFNVTRISGEDRYATAATVALNAFPASEGGAVNAIIARGDTFPDALAANYSAGLLGAPVLLTQPGQLPAVTRSALSTLGVDNVFIVGGPSAVSTAVESDLRGMGLQVARVAGNDRFETAAFLAQISGPGVVGRNEAGRRTAVLSSGYSPFDALAAGPVVYSEHFPQLLGGVVPMPAATRQALIDLDIEHVIITGGPTVIPSAMEADLASAGITSVERLQGATRYTTALAIAAKAGAAFGYRADHFNFATGTNFPDALAGGPHAGREQAPILLVPATTATEGFADVCGTLELLGPLVASAHAFGGPAVISDVVVAALDDCGTPPEAATLVGQVVQVAPATNQYTFVDQDEVVRTVIYDDQDTFRVDGTAAAVGIFEANISPGDDITFIDDPSSADADVHQLTTRTVTDGLVGNVSLADNRLAIINPVTGDVVGGPYVWSDTADELLVGGSTVALATFEGSVNEGDRVNVTLNGTDPTRFALTNAELSGVVTSRSAADTTFAAFDVDNAFGDDHETAADNVYVARASAGNGERYVVDGLPSITFTQFALALSVGDRIAVKREVESGVSVETFTLTNVSPPVISGQVTSFINTAEDPTSIDPVGDRFAVVPAAGGYQTVDYTSTPGLTGFRVGATLVDEATFEAQLSPGDTVVFQPGSTSPAVAETLTLTNAALQGQFYAINPFADLYGVYAADDVTLLALVGYAAPGTPALTNQYYFNGQQKTLTEWEVLAVQVDVSTNDLDDPIAIEIAGSFRNHRLSSADLTAP